LNSMPGRPLEGRPEVFHHRLHREGAQDSNFGTFRRICTSEIVKAGT
jgi:hypothetical protein